MKTYGPAHCGEGEGKDKGKGKQEGKGERNSISQQLSRQESCFQDMGDPGGIPVSLALIAQTGHAERPVAKKKLQETNSQNQREALINPSFRR